MIRLHRNASSEEILAVVKEWCRVLDQEDYETAYSMTWHSPKDHWTPKLMKDAISTYGCVIPRPDGQVFKVTPCETGVGNLIPRHEVDWRDKERSGIAGDVWVDLPLNGEWSDLTATFYLRRWDECLVLELNEIHVM